MEKEKGHWVIAFYGESKDPDRPAPVVFFNGFENTWVHEEAIRFVTEDCADKLIKLLRETEHYRQFQLIAEQKDLH